MVCTKLCTEIWREKLTIIKLDPISSLVKGTDKYNLISAIIEIYKSGKLSEMVKKYLLETLLNWFLNNNSNNQYWSVIEHFSWEFYVLLHSMSSSTTFSVPPYRTEKGPRKNE